MTHLYNLKQEFLQNWPLEKLNTMALEEYTNLEKTSSFCYWLEAITTELGSIWGGSAYKFGIYKRQGAKVDNRHAYQTDNEYAWVKKYGNTRDSAFEKVRSLIVAVAEYAMANNLQAVDKIDLGDAYKWKIAFLYGDFNVIPIYKYEALENSAVYLGYSGTEKSYSTLNEFIISQKGDKEFFEFYRELWNAYENPNDGIDSESKYVNQNKHLNQILYGPPGTGKTYSTIDKVVEICCPDDYIMDNHEANKIVYDQLINDGRVMFTTFHQSMSYEDFIEGIKPIINEADNETIKYEIQPGIFKQIAQTAKTPKTKSTTSIDWDKVNNFKMSIGGKNRPDIHNWCIENNVVGLSWGGEEDLSQLLTKGLPEWKKYRDDFKKLFPKTAEDKSYSIQASYILNKMNIGDIVVISKGNHIIDAIGKITGDYFFDDQTPTDMFHFRKVEWIAKDLDASPEKFFDKQISQQSIYEFYDMNIKKEAFKALTSSEETEEKPYVLVIDEINRGNVSAIFGELITLIENDKRLGMPNEIKVTLPYSKEKFGVPPNLYIIGTMNTADRSVEALDTALRRRFSFTEMPPLYDLPALEYEYAGFQGKDILKTINKRIEKLLDRDHLIGHSYFLKKAEQDAEEKLVDSFYRNIIPLLQEYFYGDYAKIGAVLGKGFIREKQIVESEKGAIFADFDGFEDSDYNEKTVYEIVDYRIENLEYDIEIKKEKVPMNFEKAIRLLMNQKITEQVES
jgi:5-methylcytosine-specific restriction enzyme B